MLTDLLEAASPPGQCLSRRTWYVPRLLGCAVSWGCSCSRGGRGLGHPAKLSRNALAGVTQWECWRQRWEDFQMLCWGLEGAGWAQPLEQHQSVNPKREKRRERGPYARSYQGLVTKSQTWWHVGIGKGARNYIAHLFYWIDKGRTFQRLQVTCPRPQLVQVKSLVFWLSVQHSFHFTFEMIEERALNKRTLGPPGRKDVSHKKRKIKGYCFFVAQWETA